MKDAEDNLLVSIFTVIILFIWSIRDISDGEVRNFNGWPNYKKNEHPINFWFISVLRLVVAFFALTVILYQLFNSR